MEGLSKTSLLRPQQLHGPKTSALRGRYVLILLTMFLLTMVLLLVIFIQSRQPTVSSVAIYTYADFLEANSETGVTLTCTCDVTGATIGDVFIENTALEGLNEFPMGVVLAMLQTALDLASNGTQVLDTANVGLETDVELSMVEDRVIDGAVGAVEMLMNFASTANTDLATQNQLISDGMDLLTSALYVIMLDTMNVELPATLVNPADFVMYVSADMVKRIKGQLRVLREIRTVRDDHEAYFNLLKYATATSILDSHVHSMYAAGSNEAQAWIAYLNNTASTVPAWDTAPELLVAFLAQHNTTAAASFNPSAPDTSYAPDFFSTDDDSQVFPRLLRKVAPTALFFEIESIFLQTLAGLGEQYTRLLVDDLSGTSSVQEALYDACGVNICEASKLEGVAEVLLRMIAYVSPALSFWTALLAWWYARKAESKVNPSNQNFGAPQEQVIYMAPSNKSSKRAGETKTSGTVTNMDLLLMIRKLQKELSEVRGKNTVKYLPPSPATYGKFHSFHEASSGRDMSKSRGVLSVKRQSQTSSPILGLNRVLAPHSDGKTVGYLLGADLLSPQGNGEQKIEALIPQPQMAPAADKTQLAEMEEDQEDADASSSEEEVSRKSKKKKTKKKRKKAKKKKKKQKKDKPQHTEPNKLPPLKHLPGGLSFKEDESSASDSDDSS